MVLVEMISRHKFLLTKNLNQELKNLMEKWKSGILLDIRRNSSIIHTHHQTKLIEWKLWTIWFTPVSRGWINPHALQQEREAQENSLLSHAELITSGFCDERSRLSCYRTFGYLLVIAMWIKYLKSRLTSAVHHTALKRRVWYELQLRQSCASGAQCLEISPTSGAGIGAHYFYETI